MKALRYHDGYMAAPGWWAFRWLRNSSAAWIVCFDIANTGDPINGCLNIRAIVDDFGSLIEVRA